MNLREENITKSLLLWLENNSWKILAFDFPQSGTGIILHPNEDIRETKNKGSIIPDIIAIKDENVVFFENKDRYDGYDFEKVNLLRTENPYEKSIAKFLERYCYSNIYFGIGLPNTSNIRKKIDDKREMLDFALLVSSSRDIHIYYQSKLIFQ